MTTMPSLLGELEIQEHFRTPTISHLPPVHHDTLACCIKTQKPTTNEYSTGVLEEVPTWAMQNLLFFGPFGIVP
jgi:hypothetical protein